MCGRLACTLSPENICRACSLKDSDTGTYYAPEWINSNKCWNYRPSHNVAPTDVTPVLVSGKHFPEIASTEKTVVHPMIWGMIPPWHKGSFNNHKLSTNNCRLENIMESRLYNEPLRQGRRCVVVCDGFYEWQTTKGSQKQPYFIYASQSGNVKIEDESTWTESWDSEVGWQGPILLKLAGLFNVWISNEGEKLFSYSVITMESNATLNWLHHRMPAVLDKEDDIKAWLDYGKMPSRSALNMLKQVESLSWHPVDTIVNNSRNKDPRCNKPKSSKPKSAGSSFMESWLKSNREKKGEIKNDGLKETEDSPTPSKRLKDDNI